MDLVKPAIGLRVFIWLLSFLSDGFIEDYDSCVKLPGSHVPDTLIGSLFSSLAKWDSLFFLQIAHEGYLYEKNHAFFPMYPMLIRFLSHVLYPLEFIMTNDEVYLISAVIISWGSYAISAYYMSKLSVVVLKNKSYSNWTSALYLLSPACIFLTAIYSEPLFGALSVSGLFYLFRDSWKLGEEGIEYAIPGADRARATILFTLATATRSNGSLLFIFPLCMTVNRIINAIKQKNISFAFIVEEGFLLAGSGFLQALPIFSVLFYGFTLYCEGDPSPYCQGPMPNIYNYVQGKYWNVGFLKYWEIKQIPNFLLASPMIFISIMAIWTYIAADPKRFFTSSAYCKKIKSAEEYINSPVIVPFVFYWAANLFILVFIANVQIITRTFCTLPTLYWYLGDTIFTKHRWISGIFFVYLFLGIHMFSNFYPWT